MRDIRKLLSDEAPASIMGILNITTDSFSDGGAYISLKDAVTQAKRMVSEGARVIDVGAESTRPGAVSVNEGTQIERVTPVIERLRQELPAEIFISIDTRSALVADRALDVGADIINDVTAGGDPKMFRLAADLSAPIVLMHMQGSPETMQDNPQYEDVVSEVLEFLLGRAQDAEKQGVSREQIVIDPGIGFGKSREHNLALVRNLKIFADTPYPVLLGASRKRFMGAICQETVFSELVGATCATTVLGAQAGVKLFRVHDVKENRQALELCQAI